jgi:putative transposase
MIAFIDDHRAIYGVEPICRMLPIAPSTYHAHAARRADPDSLPARTKSDAALGVEIRRVFEANFCVYGVRKVWRQLSREGIVVARCTVARLMRASSPLSNGSTGSTTAACSNPSATCLPPRPKRVTMPRPRCKPWLPNPNQMASGKPGAVQRRKPQDAHPRRGHGTALKKSGRFNLPIAASCQALCLATRVHLALFTRVMSRN